MTESQESSAQRRPDFEGWHESRQFDQAATIASPLTSKLLREIVALILIIVLCDLTLYRSRGYAGPGVLFLAAPLLLFLGSVRRKRDVSIWLLVPMLLFVSARLFWCGSDFAIASGFVVLACFAMSLVGLRPYMTRVALFASHLIPAGHRGLHHYFQSVARSNPRILRTHWFAILLPLSALVAFTTIFVLANPDLVKSFGHSFGRIAEWLQDWASHFEFTEILFCCGVGWVAIGLLRPDYGLYQPAEVVRNAPGESTRSPLYDAYRNTLAVVIGLFAVYLVFEFKTLWFKTFPQGFYYSGYAHEGAAWLTVALGLATLMLSLIFRGTILADPRLASLKALSWIWSIENLLLAIAVFNRLFIYIGFNGMTRMRVIGMLGVASVVIGFLLALRKIARNHDFVWLIRRQLWTVSFAAYLYAVLPVDAFVNQFNVNQILAGNNAPCVQISVHPTSDEGFLCLKPLIHCKNNIIRDGVRAMLDEKHNELEIEIIQRKSLGWTVTQISRFQLIEQLRKAKSEWQNDQMSIRRDMMRKAFHDYAYQWY